MNKKTTLIITLSIVIIAVLTVAGIFFARQKQDAVQNPVESQTATSVDAGNGETTSSTSANSSTESSVVSATAPGLSSCVVLDEEYCSKGKPFYYPTDDSTAAELKGKLSSVDFNLPEGAKIYAPFDGVAEDVMYIDENGKEVKMIIVMALPIANLSNALEMSFTNADLEPSLKKEISTNGPKKMIIYKDSLNKTDENIVGAGTKVNKGELIGKINDLSFARDNCNLFIDSFNKNFVESSRPTVNIEKLREYFSYIK
ncbi:MAG: hypothetical protein WCX77_02885 [Candidatus Paceibacterota bacterium]|jgi:hypothetical protein